MKTVTITFKDGELKVNAEGFANAKCLDALKEIEAILGVASEIELKPEGRVREQVAVKQTTKA